MTFRGGFLFAALTLSASACIGCGSNDEPGSHASGGHGASGGKATGGSGGSATGGSGGAGASGGSSGADGGVIPAGSRILAMEIDQPDGKDHAAELDVAMGLGVHGVPPALPWSLLEPTPNQIDVGWVSAMNMVYAPRGVRVMLTIPTVDTVSLLVPSDLSSTLDSGALAFDDPAVIARFQAVLDKLLGAVDPALDLFYVLVGNEVNIYLANKPDSFWSSYRGFIDAARTFIKSKRPNTQVGVNIAFSGVSGLESKIQTLVQNQDVFFVSYYQNANQFSGGQSNDLATDMSAMLALAGSKPLVLKEFGYPTGVSGNSPDGQVAFIQQLFTIWDQKADRIPFTVFSRMFDGKQTDCEAQAAAYGFPGNTEFIAFLCTLGLRTYDDQPKPAWATLASETQARGF